NAGLADSQAQPVSENEIRMVAADGDSGNNRADESGSAVSGKNSEVTVKGSSLFKGADSIYLLKKARTMVSVNGAPY
ncbi:TPA: hypothetical protein ACIYD4_005926, partial [Escherichia coli]